MSAMFIIGFSSDMNHACKTLFSQMATGLRIIRGSGTVYDHSLLRLSGVLPREVWQRTDFSSDLVVLRACSAQSICAILALKDEDPHSVIITALTLLFLRCDLFATNSRQCPRRLRIHMLWASMIWFTSLQGVHPITTKTFVASCISACFNAIRDDVQHLRYTMEEVCSSVSSTLHISLSSMTLSALC
jgi:hypothetical protein